MRTIARFMDARNTTEGKFLSVLLSVLLVFSFLNVTMFTDYAGADTTPEGDDTEIVTPLEDVDEPEAQPEDEADGPESEEPAEEVNETDPAADVIGTDDEVVSSDTTKDSSNEPAGEVNESEAPAVAEEPAAGSERIVAHSQNLAAEPNAAAVLSADFELTIGDSESLEYSSKSKFDNYRWEVISGGHVVNIANAKGKLSGKNPYTYSNSVTAIGAGTATVAFQTSKYGLLWTTQQTWTIEVTAPVLTGITIGGSDTVAEFATVNLTAKLSPDGAVGQVVWASDDPSVATVDGSGRVTGVAAGKVTIRASVTNPDGPSVTDEYEVTVTKSRSTHSAEFYYLKSPDSDPASNGTNNWGKQ